MPDNTETAFLVNASSDPVVVVVNGRASFLNSAPLNEFIRRQTGSGRLHFVIDFKNCTGMDSTFLGIIAGAALEVRELEPPGKIILSRLGPRNLELVRNLGLHRIVEIDAQDDFERGDAGASAAASGLDGLEQGEVENAKMILRAHQNLVECDEGNQAKFEDVITFLKNQIDDS